MFIDASFLAMIGPQRGETICNLYSTTSSRLRRDSGQPFITSLHQSFFGDQTDDRFNLFGVNKTDERRYTLNSALNCETPIRFRINIVREKRNSSFIRQTYLLNDRVHLPVVGIPYRPEMDYDNSIALEYLLPVIDVNRSTGWPPGIVR